MSAHFESRLNMLQGEYEKLINRPNVKQEYGNGIFYRYRHPVLTAAHTPISWRYDLNENSNPFLMERFGINAVFNAGAIKFDGKYILAARVEGADRKSFFALAESDNGTDGFRFRPFPLLLPETVHPDVNVYDMRLTQHEDGWIYGLFCTERRDASAPVSDQSAAIAQCGIVRTKDLENWERLPDLVTPSAQQRNVVLHPEYIQGQYAFYTRPQDGFIEAGKGGGIGFGLCADITSPHIKKETVIDPRVYHTVYEAKNGLGPAPLKTQKGWLHLAHGVRHTAAGLRYVLYLFMTALDDITRIIHKPGGYFMAPEGEERIGDVSNVLFCNGWIEDEDGRILIYYASSDTRMHVAETSTEQLIDYVTNTEEDTYTSAGSVRSVLKIITENEGVFSKSMF